VSAEDGALPESTAGREFALNAMAEEGLLADKKRFEAAGAGKAVLERLKRDPGNYKRNRAKICSFFVKGTCTRGVECPYRHEMPEEGHDQGFSMKNVRARYHGVDDPNAKKMLDRMDRMNEGGAAASTSSLEPPADRSITTLFVGGVGEGVSEDDIRAALEGAGELKSVKKLGARKCAFATFRKREGAEAAMRVHGAGGLRVGSSDKPLTLLWGKPKKGGEAHKDTRAVGVGVGVGVGSGGTKAYSSQDPARDGAPVPVADEEGRNGGKKKAKRT
jgi:pre-mRNA-splicing factor RBM22/SLT11